MTAAGDRQRGAFMAAIGELPLTLDRMCSCRASERKNAPPGERGAWGAAV